LSKFNFVRQTTGDVCRVSARPPPIFVEAKTGLLIGVKVYSISLRLKSGDCPTIPGNDKSDFQLCEFFGIRGLKWEAALRRCSRKQRIFRFYLSKDWGGVRSNKTQTVFAQLSGLGY